MLYYTAIIIFVQNESEEETIESETSLMHRITMIPNLRQCVMHVMGCDRGSTHHFRTVHGLKRQSQRPTLACLQPLFSSPLTVFTPLVTLYSSIFILLSSFFLFFTFSYIRSNEVT